MEGNLSAYWGCCRTKFKVHGAHNAYVVSQLQFHVGERQLVGTQHDSISFRDIKLGTDQAFGMFHQEERPGWPVRWLPSIKELPFRDTHDASRQEFRKRECVITSDLCVDELRIWTAFELGTATWMTDTQPFLQRAYGTWGESGRDRLK
jgi:hypothetical protein